jgi:hypothetical protein
MNCKAISVIAVTIVLSMGLLSSVIRVDNALAQRGGINGGAHCSTKDGVETCSGGSGGNLGTDEQIGGNGGHCTLSSTGSECSGGGGGQSQSGISGFGGHFTCTFDPVACNSVGGGGSTTRGP